MQICFQSFVSFSCFMSAHSPCLLSVWVAWSSSTVDMQLSDYIPGGNSDHHDGNTPGGLNDQDTKDDDDEDDCLTLWSYPRGAHAQPGLATWCRYSTCKHSAANVYIRLLQLNISILLWFYDSYLLLPQHRAATMAQFESKGLIHTSIRPKTLNLPAILRSIHQFKEFQMLFTESTNSADSVIESQCPSVCLFVTIQNILFQRSNCIILIFPCDNFFLLFISMILTQKKLGPKTKVRPKNRIED